jgi:hypothetical protein
MTWNVERQEKWLVGTNYIVYIDRLDPLMQKRVAAASLTSRNETNMSHCDYLHWRSEKVPQLNVTPSIPLGLSTEVETQNQCSWQKTLEPLYSNEFHLHKRTCH